MTKPPQRLRIGEGRISGYLSIFLALISLGAVVCFHFPEYFTTPEFRAVYAVEVLRWLLLACLVLAFCLAFTSFLLSGKSKLGLIGVLVTALAIVLGGNTVEIDDFDQSLVSISLDWLLIDILVLSAIFIPIELFLPKRSEQTKFHLEWKTGRQVRLRTISAPCSRAGPVPSRNGNRAYTLSPSTCAALPACTRRCSGMST